MKPSRFQFFVQNKMKIVKTVKQEEKPTKIAVKEEEKPAKSAVKEED